MRVALSVSFLLLAACGKAEQPAGSDQGGAGGAAGAGGAGGAAGSGGSAGEAPCSEDPLTLPAGAVCIMEVKGRVVDVSDAPVPDVSVSACGSVCWYGTSEASGAFTISVGAQIVPDAYSALPHGRPSRTNFYFALPQPQGSSVEMGDLLILDLPPSGPKLVVKTDKAGAPAQAVTSGEVTLEVAAGVQVKLDVEDVALKDEGKQFRALSIPDGLRARFASPALGLSQLYALTPFEAALVAEAGGAPALGRLAVANTSGLAPGGAVEFLALGTYLFSEWLKPAAFEVVATGTVSSDGKQIEMDGGQGVRYLTWIGVRPKP